MTLLRSSFVVVASILLGACTSELSQEAVGVDSEELTVCASGSTQKGVDVSHHNGTVSWSKVKASGRSYGFARVADGLTTPDTQFASNWRNMKTAGVIRGVYQFYRPRRDGVQQADLLLSKVAAAGGFAAGDLPPVIDIEVSDDQPASLVVSRAKDWIRRVEQKLGVKPIVYTGNHMAGVIGTAFAAYPLWVAHYGVSCPRVPDGWTKWTFWQESESGTVSGVGSGNVDLDRFNGTLTTLKALTMKHAITPEEIMSDIDPATTAGIAAEDGGETDAVMGDSAR